MNTTILKYSNANKLPFASLLDNYQLTNDETQKILTQLQFTKVKKGEVFLSEGKICRRLGILVSGLLYAYYGTDKVNVSRFFYLPKNPIVVSFDSFKNQRESKETITAIEDSYLGFFSYEGLNKLYKTVPKLEKIGRELAEASYSQALERIHSLQSLKTKARFDKFFKEESELLNRVGQQLIGSYLRMNRDLIRKYTNEINR